MRFYGSIFFIDKEGGNLRGHVTIHREDRCYPVTLKLNPSSTDHEHPEVIFFMNEQQLEEFFYSLSTALARARDRAVLEEEVPCSEPT